MGAHVDHDTLSGAVPTFRWEARGLCKPSGRIRFPSPPLYSFEALLAMHGTLNPGNQVRFLAGELRYTPCLLMTTRRLEQFQLLPLELQPCTCAFTGSNFKFQCWTVDVCPFLNNKRSFSNKFLSNNPDSQL